MKAVEPWTVPDVAVMVVEPAAAVVASPALLIVATPFDDEVHVAVVVRFRVVPSLSVPVAVNCTVVPSVVDDDVAVVTAIELSVGVGVGGGGGGAGFEDPPHPSSTDATTSPKTTFRSPRRSREPGAPTMSSLLGMAEFPRISQVGALGTLGLTLRGATVAAHDANASCLPERSSR